jgi:gliding motility-associated lipoprotein GldD
MFLNSCNTRQQSRFLYFLILSFFNFLIFTSCKENHTPKKNGYFRIDFPTEKKYQTYSNPLCPFSFEYPGYGSIQKDTTEANDLSHPCWFNIIIPEHKAKIYLTYTAVDASNTLDKLIKDSYTLTFKHAIRADYIDETPVHPQPGVSGILYDVGGNSASAVQFYLTDSTRHFLRGSLYFYSAPNVDSLLPGIDYFRKDMEHIINTLAWK